MAYGQKNDRQTSTVTTNAWCLFPLFIFEFTVFGLGPAELTIVAVAALIVIGPSKLLEFSKEAGSVAGKTVSGVNGMGEEWSEELKAIPEEFRKGVELGEMEARSRKAKVMTNVDDKEDIGNELDDVK